MPRNIDDTFVVMIERGITAALTDDVHFKQTGFEAFLKGAGA